MCGWIQSMLLHTSKYFRFRKMLLPWSHAFIQLWFGFRDYLTLSELKIFAGVPFFSKNVGGETMRGLSYLWYLPGFLGQTCLDPARKRMFSKREYSHQVLGNVQHVMTWLYEAYFPTWNKNRIPSKPCLMLLLLLLLLLLLVQGQDNTYVFWVCSFYF